MTSKFDPQMFEDRSTGDHSDHAQRNTTLPRDAFPVAPAIKLNPDSPGVQFGQPHIDVSPLDWHEKVALSLSCGKDSLSCLYLLRPYLDRITVYCLSTGDTFPEVERVIEQVRPLCPNFVHIQNDVRSFIREYGHPTDLLPYSMHGIGSTNGDVKLVTRYHCCFTNLMWPLWSRIKEDGNTLCIRGTKASDVPQPTARSGETHDGVELWYPVKDWSDADALTYLESQDAPRNPMYYGNDLSGTHDCMRCTAWWNPKRAAYLKRHYPIAFEEFSKDIRAVAGQLEAPIKGLHATLGVMG